MNGLIKNIGKWCVKHAPEILTTVAIGGVVCTAVMSAKAAPKAKKAVEEAKEEKAKELNVPVEELPMKDNVLTTAKAGWKYYVPTAISAGCTIAAFVAASDICKKRAAAAAVIASIAQETLSTYEEKLEEVLGTKKKHAIDDKVIEVMTDKPVPEEKKDDNGNYIQETPPFKGKYKDRDNFMLYTGHGLDLCQDAFSGRYFRASREFMDKVLNKLHCIINHNDRAALNEYYDLIGLDPVLYGEDLEWARETADSLPEYHIDVKQAETGEPCLVFGFCGRNRPLISEYNMKSYLNGNLY